MAREVMKAHGLHLHLASDRAADDELFGNVAAHMWACKYGIALFETRFGSEFNDNLQIEVGAMLMTGGGSLCSKIVRRPTCRPTSLARSISPPILTTSTPSDANFISGLPKISALAAARLARDRTKLARSADMIILRSSVTEEVTARFLSLGVRQSAQVRKAGLAD